MMVLYQVPSKFFVAWLFKHLRQLYYMYYCTALGFITQQHINIDSHIKKLLFQNLNFKK